MKLIIGLGNPGIKYYRTRHNLGFLVIEKIAKRNRISFNKKECKAIFGEGRVGRSKVVTIKPLTYVNLSGISVRALIERYHLDIQDIVVVYDDVNLRLGRIRIRRSGSHGGHNGLKSIISCLDSEDFPRLRVGIAGENMKGDLTGYVLSKFAKDDKKTVEQIIERAAEAAETIIKRGITVAMERYNC